MPATRPDVTIVIPVFDKLELTRVCLASLVREPVEHSFEVVVVDNGSTDGTAAWLAEAEAAGTLRALINSQNTGFAAACNQGASAARGRHLLFLNNDTEVTAGWLDPLVDTLDRDAQVHAVGARLLYPDGTIQHAGVALVETATEHGTRLDGHHLGEKQPADHPDSNRCKRLQAVSAALMAVRRDVFEDLGGFDTAYWNGNEDLDLCLRIGEGGGVIVYRPESVVFHHESASGPERWRKVGENIRLLNERWQGRALPDIRRDADGAVKATDAGRMGLYVSPSLRLPRPADPGSVTVLVLTWNALDYTKLCAASLLEHTDSRHELMFVDNGSERDTLEFLATLEADHPGRVTVIRNGHNLGFAGGNNVGMARARGEHVCLLNSDVVVTASWLEPLLKRLENPEIGLVGPVTNSIAGAQKLPAVAYDESNLEGLDVFAARRARAEKDQSRLALWVVGFCTLLRRQLIERIGGLDEGFGQGNYEDTDYGLRALVAGWHSTVALDSFVHHFGSRSFVAGKVDYIRQIDAKWEIFRRKWSLPDGPSSRVSLDPTNLVAEGYAPALHAEPLPQVDGVVQHPLAAWEVQAAIVRGESLFAGGRLVAAEKAFRAILRDHPHHDRAASDLACVLWQGDPRGSAAEAVTLLEGVLGRDPGNNDARWNLEEMKAAACESG